MTEKKFYMPGIILPVVGLLLHAFVGAAAIDLVIAAVSLILNLRKRETHRIKIGIVITILLILGILSIIGIMIFERVMFGGLLPEETVPEMILHWLFW